MPALNTPSHVVSTLVTPDYHQGDHKGAPLLHVGQVAAHSGEDAPVVGDEAQQLRRLPDDVVDTLIDEGMFRFTLPPELGGEDATSLETIEVLEAISAIDASVGWNVMLGSEINAMAAGGMPNMGRPLIFGTDGVINGSNINGEPIEYDGCIPVSEANRGIADSCSAFNERRPIAVLQDEHTVTATLGDEVSGRPAALLPVLWRARWGRVS